MHHDAHLPDIGESKAVSALLTAASPAHMATLLHGSELRWNLKDLVAMETLEQLRLRGTTTRSSALAARLAIEHLAMRLHNTTTPALRRLHIVYTLIRNLGRTDKPELDDALAVLESWMSTGRSHSFASAVISRASELAHNSTLVTNEVAIRLREIIRTIQANYPKEVES